jgi:hypothetical protein
MQIKFTNMYNNEIIQKHKFLHLSEPKFKKENYEDKQH